MNKILKLKSFLAVQLGALLALACAHGQSPEFFFVVKDAFYWQFQPGAVSFIHANAGAGIEGVPAGSIQNPQLMLPGGGAETMEYDFDDEGYLVETDNGTLEEINAEVPNGHYRITGTGSSLGAFDVHLNLAGVFPQPPVITNYAQLQETDPSGSVTLEWSPFNSATGAAHRFVQVFGRSLFSDHEFETDLLAPGTTSFTIPAGTFPPQSKAQIEVAFLAASQFDEGGGPGGATIAAAYIASTEFQFPGDIQPTDPAIAFFADDLFGFPGSQWYFSFTFKDIHHFPGGNWFLFNELNSYLWVAINSSSLAEGFWSYATMTFADHTSWIFMARDGNFYDLRDPGHTGVNTLPDSEAGAQTLNGYIFMVDPIPGDPPGAQWYYFSQFGDENWMLNLGIENPTNEDWHRVR